MIFKTRLQLQKYSTQSQDYITQREVFPAERKEQYMVTRCYHGLVTRCYTILRIVHSSVNTCQIFALHFGGGAGVHYTTDQTQQGLQLNEGRGSQMKKEGGTEVQVLPWLSSVTMVTRCYVLCTKTDPAS